MPKTLKEIAKFLNGELVGDGEVTVKSVKGMKDAQEGDIAFIATLKDEELVNVTKASCVLVPRNISKSFNKPTIKVDYPSVALSKIIEFIMPGSIPHPKGIHKTSVISDKASLGKNVSVGPYAVIEDGVSIGDNTVVYAFCYIGKGAQIGKDCIFYPHVTIRERIVISDRVIIHPSTVVGSDGFGFDTQRDGTHFKVPQIGTVVIEDDVEIGSCCTIDRARFDKTVIGKGAKIDNLVQIAHNVVIGPYCLIAAQCGISGSTTLGRNVVFAGQVGVVDHVKLGDFVVAAGKTGITKSYPAKSVLFGYPARTFEKAKELLGSAALLPKLFIRVRQLEDKIKELEKK